MSQYQQAIADYNKAIQEDPRYAPAFYNCGNINKDLGENQYAIAIYERALVYIRETGDWEREGITLDNIGTVFEFKGQYEQALEYFNQSLTIAREIGNNTFEKEILKSIDELPNHTYSATGIYDICLTVNDGSLDSEPSCTFAVVYDSDWKSKLWFCCQVQEGCEYPTGNTEFQFKGSDLNFHSTSYE